MLRNRAYVGEVEFGGKVVKAAHEPLVPKDLWENVQKLIRERRGAAKKAPVAEPHPLAGLVSIRGLCAVRTETAVTRKRWCVWRGSNPQPSAPEADALSN